MSDHPADIQTAIVGPYTLAYAGTGAFLRRVGFSGLETVVVAVAWEVASRPLKRSFPAIFPDERQDTLTGAAVDVIAMLAGWYASGLLEPDG